MRLSDKLQDFLVNGPNMWGPQYETIQQAYRLAKRYEDAPVGRVDMAVAQDAVVVDELADTYPLLKQRVRLVVEGGEG